MNTKVKERWARSTNKLSNLYSHSILKSVMVSQSENVWFSLKSFIADASIRDCNISQVPLPILFLRSRSWAIIRLWDAGSHARCVERKNFDCMDFFHWILHHVVVYNQVRPAVHCHLKTNKHTTDFTSFDILLNTRFYFDDSSEGLLSKNHSQRESNFKKDDLWGWWSQPMLKVTRKPTTINKQAADILLLGSLPTIPWGGGVKVRVAAFVKVTTSWRF